MERRVCRVKKGCIAFLVFALLFSSAMAEGFDLSNMTLEGSPGLLSADRSELITDEPSLVEKATDLLLSTWKNKVYGDYAGSEHGYLEIVHTQITYIKKSYAARDLTGKAGDDLFHNVFCVIDFMLLSDYYGSAPYYVNTDYYSSIIVYRNGEMEAVSVSPFKRYIGITYRTDFSEMIESVHDCGDKYNAAFNLLDQ